MDFMTVQLTTPYGRVVSAKKSTDPADPACYLNAEAAALMAGIFDPSQRARFISEFGHVAFSEAYLHSLGGHKVSSVPLSPPKRPLADQHEALRDKVPVDDHRTIVLSAVDWPERAKNLGDVIDLNLKRDFGRELVALAIAELNDGAMELLREDCISCLEAAVFYSFSGHKAWAKAGNRWLTPFVDTWLADWLRQRPVIEEFARLLRVLRPSAATWLRA